MFNKMESFLRKFYFFPWSYFYSDNLLNAVIFIEAMQYLYRIC